MGSRGEGRRIRTEGGGGGGGGRAWGEEYSDWLSCWFVVVLHMPGLARWLAPGRSSCGSTLFVIFLIMYYLFILMFFFCFFFLLLFLLLILLLLPASSSWGSLPFWQES